MTIMSNSSFLPRDLFGADTELSTEELCRFVEGGLITRIDNHKEHYAIQPCWMNDPGRGVMEEINGNVLGKWDTKLKSYIVHVDSALSNDRSVGMNEDHRWLHINIVATFYTYTPVEGQQLKGPIKKIGRGAAVCMVFDVFTATVFPRDDSELISWSEGQELEFEVTSFIHRRKGPVIRATAVGPQLGKSKSNKRKFFEEEEDPAVEENWEDPNPEPLENGYDLDETQVLPESSKSKKKKHKKLKRDPDLVMESFAEAGDMSSNWQNEETNELDETQDIESLKTKKKKKKKKKSSHNEDD